MCAIRYVCVSCFWLMQVGVGLATETIERTELILSSNPGLGVGGGPQGGFGLVKVCDSQKISPKNLPTIIRLAMDRIDATIDSTAGIKSASDGGTKWKTKPTFIPSKEVDSYNKNAGTAELLYTHYRYYYIAEAELRKEDDTVTIESKISLYIGTRPEELESYSGIYSGKFIHNKLSDAITESLSEMSCK